MPETIRVPVPDEDTDLVWYFDEQIENDQFGQVLDYSIKQHGDRANILEVRVADVEVLESGVVVHYEVDWDAYYGCSDANRAGTSERRVRGVLDGADWVFEVNVPLPERDTFEEF